jgi:uncharacterized protein (TIGR00730 family)
MKSICVFLGASVGNSEIYSKSVIELGHLLADNNITCVYGGSNTGLMKLLADSVLEKKGKVIGITVQALHDKEIFHKDLTELHVVTTMHERKALMAEFADAFIVLPGGIGTFEEFFEVYTWKKLGFHSKPCGILNINNYYEPMRNMLNQAKVEGFMTKFDSDLIFWEESPSDMLNFLLNSKS